MSSQSLNPTLDTKTRILSAALKLLEAHDGTGVRVGDIAKKAGISRQALYLHFKTRSELLVAVTYYLDEQKDVPKKLALIRSAPSGLERLNAFIDAWTKYIPEIYPVAKALIAMSETDADADSAWTQRMQDVREACGMAIKALNKDKMLSQNYSEKEATDLLWTLLSVQNWEQMVRRCGWTQKKYADTLKLTVKNLFVL